MQPSTKIKNHPILKYLLSANAPPEQRNFAENGNKPALWSCPNRHPDWKANPSSVKQSVRLHHTSGCMKCRGVKIITKDPRLSKLFSEENSPEKKYLTLTSKKEIKWDCSTHGKFKAKVRDVAKSGCPDCISSQPTQTTHQKTPPSSVVHVLESESDDSDNEPLAVKIARKSSTKQPRRVHHSVTPISDDAEKDNSSPKELTSSSKALWESPSVSGHTLQAITPGPSRSPSPNYTPVATTPGPNRSPSPIYTPVATTPGPNRSPSPIYTPVATTPGPSRSPSPNYTPVATTPGFNRSPSPNYTPVATTPGPSRSPSPNYTQVATTPGPNRSPSPNYTPVAITPSPRSSPTPTNSPQAITPVPSPSYTPEVVSSAPDKSSTPTHSPQATAPVADGPSTIQIAKNMVVNVKSKPSQAEETKLADVIARQHQQMFETLMSQLKQQQELTNQQQQVTQQLRQELQQQRETTERLEKQLEQQQQSAPTPKETSENSSSPAATPQMTTMEEEHHTLSAPTSEKSHPTPSQKNTSTVLAPKKKQVSGKKSAPPRHQSLRQAMKQIADEQSSATPISTSKETSKNSSSSTATPQMTTMKERHLTCLNKNKSTDSASKKKQVSGKKSAPPRHQPLSPSTPIPNKEPNRPKRAADTSVEEKRKKAFLSTEEPEIAKMYRSNDIKPLAEVTTGMRFTAKWECEKGHTWERSVQAEVASKGCKICSKDTIKYLTDLPEVAKRYHPEKNDKTIEGITQGSHDTATWRCTANKTHPNWVRSVAKEVESKGCKICLKEKRKKEKRKPAPLLTTLPEVAKRYRSNDIKPLEEVTTGMNFTAKWECEKGHTWERSVQAEVKSGGCRKCLNDAKPGKKHLTDYPEVAARYHPENKKTIADVTAGSHYPATWRCTADKTHPTWQRPVCREITSKGCPACWTKLNHFKLLTEYPEVVKRWHPDNGSIEGIKSCSKIEATWQCLKNKEHPTWERPVAKEVISQGCPECVKERKRSNTSSSNPSQRKKPKTSPPTQKRPASAEKTTPSNPGKKKANIQSNWVRRSHRAQPNHDDQAASAAVDESDLEEGFESSDDEWNPSKN